MCKINQPVGDFRFKKAKCRLCVYLQRYRYRHTKDQFKEYAENNI